MKLQHIVWMQEWMRYGIASILTYAWMFGGTFVATEYLNIPAYISYGIVITITYVANYFLNAHYVFARSTSRVSVVRFGIHSMIFWLLNNVFYLILFHFTAIHYLLLVALNILIFMPIRFLSMKHYVFGTEKEV